jgi:hypothetical protein
MSWYLFLLSISFIKFQDRSHISNLTALRIFYRNRFHYTILLGFLHLSEKFKSHLNFHCSVRIIVHAGQASTLPHTAPRLRRQWQTICHTGPGEGFVPSLYSYNSLKHSGSQHAELSVTQFWKPLGPTPVTEMVQSRQAPAFVIQSASHPQPSSFAYDLWPS